MRFVTLKAKTGLLQKRDLEHISGGHYGVLNVPARGVAFESCQHHEILNDMPVTSAAMLTVARIPSEGNRWNN